jgi:hypothetical protein
MLMKQYRRQLEKFSHRSKQKVGSVSGGEGGSVTTAVCFVSGNYVTPMLELRQGKGKYEIIHVESSFHFIMKALTILLENCYWCG